MIKKEKNALLFTHWSVIRTGIDWFYVINSLTKQENFLTCVSLLQAVLQPGGQLELEIRPLFLVPDTNGFIDHLEGLKKVLHCGSYIIVVPLIGKPKQREKFQNSLMKVNNQDFGYKR